MAKKKKSRTDSLHKMVQPMAEELMPVFGLKNILSAGVLLFVQLSAEEQRLIIQYLNGKANDKPHVRAAELIRQAEQLAKHKDT